MQISDSHKCIQLKVQRNIQHNIQGHSEPYADNFWVQPLKCRARRYKTVLRHPVTTNATKSCCAYRHQSTLFRRKVLECLLRTPGMRRACLVWGWFDRAGSTSKQWIRSRPKRQAMWGWFFWFYVGKSLCMWRCLFWFAWWWFVRWDNRRWQKRRQRQCSHQAKHLGRHDK